MVITIGREYGSGGKYIGTLLADRLGIKLYDKELLTQLQQTSRLDAQTLQQHDEVCDSSYLSGGYLFSSRFRGISLDEQVFQETAALIRRLAEDGDCIVIGRCANRVLRDRDALHVFIYASDPDFKLQRKMRLDGLPEEEARRAIRETDKKRAVYYAYHTDGVWGAKKEYDLCIDTARLGVEQAAALIAFCFRQKKEAQSHA